MYTGKPEAKAGLQTRVFRINLKDGYNQYNNNYFGAFDEWWSGPLGRATGPCTDPYNNAAGLFDNWSGSLTIHFQASLRGAAFGSLYPIEIYGGGYNRKGYSGVENLTGSPVPYDIDWFGTTPRNLSITNIDEVPILGMDPADPELDLGIIYELDPLNPNDPIPGDIYWNATSNGSNIDINIAVYPVPVQSHFLWSYGRPGTALPN